MTRRLVNKSHWRRSKRQKSTRYTDDIKHLDPSVQLLLHRCSAAHRQRRNSYIAVTMGLIRKYGAPTTKQLAALNKTLKNGYGITPVEVKVVRDVPVVEARTIAKQELDVTALVERALELRQRLGSNPYLAVILSNIYDNGAPTAKQMVWLNTRFTEQGWPTLKIGQMYERPAEETLKLRRAANRKSYRSAKRHAAMPQAESLEQDVEALLQQCQQLPRSSFILSVAAQIRRLGAPTGRQMVAINNNFAEAGLPTMKVAQTRKLAKEIKPEPKIVQAPAPTRFADNGVVTDSKTLLALIQEAGPEGVGRQEAMDELQLPLRRLTKAAQWLKKHDKITNKRTRVEGRQFRIMVYRGNP